MPVIHSNSLRSPFWLPNGHFQSIYPSLFRKITLPYTRERITTPDDDFLDLDWLRAERADSNRKLVILSHGLEGSSTRQYVTGMARFLSENDYDVLAWNYRSCSQELNKQVRFYHSGETTDLQLVINHSLAKGYDEICLMGFSLGGNLTLKYVGEQGKNINLAIKKAVVFSVPMDLAACSTNIGEPQNKIYLWKFLRTLKTKVKAKSEMYPDKIKFEDYERVRDFWDFDHIYTGPVHGFEGAADYYSRNSANRFVANIAIPTLIVNAKNDPLVPYQSLAVSVIEKMPNVTLELTAQGGHCGFRPSQVPTNGAYWSEQRALAFLQ
jgi:uncharacterized protein